MKFRARLEDGRTRAVEIGENGRSVQIALDGARTRWDAVSLGDGRWSLVAEDGAQREVSVARDPEGAVRVQIGPDVLRFELLDELTALALAATGKGSARRAGEVRAAIPGRVLRLNVKEGDAVEEGTTLLVLEAMKMENEVRARHSGRVRAVAVSAGQAVAAGDVLVRFADD